MLQSQPSMESEAHAESSVLLQMEREVCKPPGENQKRRFSPRCLAALCLGSLAVVFILMLSFSRSSLKHVNGQEEVILSALDDAGYFKVAGDVPRIVWAFWFGPKMDNVRKTSYIALSTRLAMPVKLITDKNLRRYNKSSFPMHPALEFLTAVHKADYLRAYFLHVYGGGYHDVKAPKMNALKLWPKYMDMLHNSSNLWLAGGKYGTLACNESYFETSWCDELHASGKLCCPFALDEASAGRLNIPDVQGFIARRNTSLTRDWMRILHDHLDKNYHALKAHPGPPGRCCPVFSHDHLDPSGYPFIWNELLGQIVTPVFAKYSKHIIMGLPLQQDGDYRACR